MDGVQDVVDFLADPRAEVRAMAAEGVAGYTASPEGTAALTCCTGLLEALADLMRRAASEEVGSEDAAVHAAAAAVNLSQAPAERVKMLQTSVVAAAAACAARATAQSSQLSEYSAMLLSNLTQLADGVEQLLRANGGGGGARLLQPLTASSMAIERHTHLALVLVNVAQTTRGRAQLLGEIVSDGKVLASICDQLSGLDDTGRLGIARLLRNLCFAAKPAIAPPAEAAKGAQPSGVANADEEGVEAEARAALLDDAVLRMLVTRLAARLSPLGVTYEDTDCAKFSPDLAALVTGGEGANRDKARDEDCASSDGGGGNPEKREGVLVTTDDNANTDGAEGERRHERPREHQMEARLAMTEALLLLSAAPSARALMREVGVYPCLREAHLLEEDASGVPTPVRDANEQLVQIFYLSTEACGPLPEELRSGGDAAGAAAAAEAPEPPRIEELQLSPSAEVEEEPD